MEKKATVIAYRRRCIEIGKSTGLSHYILLAPKADK